MTPEHLVAVVAQWTLAGFAIVVMVAFVAWFAWQLVLMVWDV